MASRREIGSLWIGGPLTWLEQVCLKSFADHGHKITLFTYGDVGSLPDGVIQRSGREVLDTNDFIKYNRKNSYALFADLFRMHMVRKNPGMIWVDTDTYCLRPVTLEDDYVFGVENEGGSLANGVFSAPPDSELLTAILDFMEDLYPLPPFQPRQLGNYEKAHSEGNPIHISDMPWGTWGPQCLTWFAHQTDTHSLAQQRDVFYPVPYGNRRVFLKDPSRAQRFFTERSCAINLFASNKVICLRDHNGLPPKGSFLEMIAREHGVSSERFPILQPGRVRSSDRVQENDA